MAATTRARIPFLSAVKLLRYVGVVFFVPSWIKRKREAEASPLYRHFIVDLAHANVLRELVSVAKTGLGRSKTKSLGMFSIPSVLLIGPAGNGKATLARRLAHHLRMAYIEVDCFSLWSEVSGTGEAKLRNAFTQAAQSAPCVFVLKRIDVIGKDSSTDEHDVRVTTCLKSLLSSHPPVSSEPMVVIGTALQPGQVPGVLSSCFLYQFSIEPLGDEDRVKLVEGFCERHTATTTAAKNPDELRKISQRTAGYAIADIERVLETARYVAKERDLARRAKNEVSATSESSVGSDDVEAALSREQAKLSDVIGAPKIPDVRWEDVGGLASVKETILESIRLHLDHPELSKLGFKRSERKGWHEGREKFLGLCFRSGVLDITNEVLSSGILLYGPPGCGKTLIAKAVATECNLNFMSVKGPELLNMYVGQSEQNIREVFERARFASPCVIFFDELDALAPNRGRSGDSGGVMDRVVSQLLAEMDGLEQRGDLFIIGATNRVDLVDPSLLRPGRFDKAVYVGIGSDFVARMSVFSAVTRKLQLADDVDLSELVQRCPQGMSGADFYALAAEAATLAAQRKVQEIVEKRGAAAATDIEDDIDDDISDFDYRVVVTQQDFLSALSYLKPSVSASVIAGYSSSRGH